VSEIEPEATIPSAALAPLGRARLDDLLAELLTRVGDVMDTQDRLRGLLDAVVGIAGDLDLDSVLERIVRVACQLADAQYGALGVLGSGSDRRLRAFITHGLTPEQRERIGDLPRGHGILGVIIDSPEPLRLDELGKHAKSFGFPPNHPPMNTFLGVPIRIRDKVFGNLYLTEKRSGGEFTVDDEEIVVALAAAAGVAIENARLYEDTSRRQRWLEAAADVTGALLRGPDRSQALLLVAERALETADADVAAVLLRDESGALVVEATAGVVVDNLVGTDVPVGTSALQAVLTSGQPSVLDEDTLLQGGSGLELFEEGWPELRSLALLPLGTADTVAGLVLIGWAARPDESFRDTDVVLPASFAAQVALALQVAHAQEDRGRLAVFMDRDRIGRDLHDLVIQRLFAVGLTLENAVRLAVRPEVAQRITAAVDDIDSTIKDIRRTIFELSSPAGSGDIRSALGAEVAAAAPSLGFTPRLQTSGPVETAVGPDLRPHVLAVLRETLSNVSRHARASRVDVVLDVGSEVVLTVTDDGIGLPDGGRRSGLRNLTERAESCGGSFDVRRAGPDGGTVATWRVPAR
jgi:signal transduction histidine kinase